MCVSYVAEDRVIFSYSTDAFQYESYYKKYFGKKEEEKLFSGFLLFEWFIFVKKTLTNSFTDVYSCIYNFISKLKISLISEFGNF